MKQIVCCAFVFFVSTCQSQNKPQGMVESNTRQTSDACPIFYFELNTVNAQVTNPEPKNSHQYHRQTDCENAAIVEKAKIDKGKFPDAHLYCLKRCESQQKTADAAQDLPQQNSMTTQPTGQSPYSRCVRNSWINSCTSDGGFIKCNTEAAAERPSKLHLRLQSPIYKKCPEACRGAERGFNDYGC